MDYGNVKNRSSKTSTSRRSSIVNIFLRCRFFPILKRDIRARNSTVVKPRVVLVDTNGRKYHVVRQDPRDPRQDRDKSPSNVRVPNWWKLKMNLFPEILYTKLFPLCTFFIFRIEFWSFLCLNFYVKHDTT